MSEQRLSGQRVLITHADVFMGPVLCEVFARHGATVVASNDPLVHPDAPAAVVAGAGQHRHPAGQPRRAGPDDFRRGRDR